MELADRYINPLTDFGFKKLFGEEVNKELLIDFLNQLLPEKHKIKDLAYKKSDYLPQSEFDRKAIFDLYCESPTGEKFIVEVQRAKQNYFKDRSVYYASFPIQQQAIKGGDWDFKLEAVYTIGILDFVFEEDKEDREYIHTVQLKNQKNRLFYDKLTFIYIELPKFDKTAEELESKIEKWLFVFRYLARLQDRPEALQEKIYEKLFAAAEIAKFSREERELYEQSLKYYRDLKNVVDTAFEEGEIKGKIEGLIEGEIKGKIEEKMGIAAEMKADGVPVGKISRYTGLSKEEIEKL
jgi:predicted transposase/invertase (TIGR01784 family)